MRRSRETIFGSIVRDGSSDARMRQVEGLVRDNRVEVRVLFGASERPCKCRAFLVHGQSRRPRHQQRHPPRSPRRPTAGTRADEGSTANGSPKNWMRTGGPGQRAHGLVVDKVKVSVFV